LVVPLLKESMNEHGKTRRRVEIRKPHVGHLASTVQQRHEDDPVNLLPMMVQTEESAR
jgi:hypothetical protein